MKKPAILLSTLFLFAVVASGQEAKTNAALKIPAAQARQHLNDAAVVSGKVVEVNKAEKIVRLNFEKPFPNQPFQAVIFADKTNLFPNIDQLQDKQVEVKGRISEYRGRPQIIITETNQLRVLKSSTD